VGDDPTSAAFSAPLYGGSPEEWVTGLEKLQERLQDVLFLQLDRKRYRHRVAPNTALARSPVISPPLNAYLKLGEALQK
jgi:hypothetical protein